jgi:hypothetical protein
MATLKICANEKVYWLDGVARIVDDHDFTVNWDEIMYGAFENSEMPDAVYTTGFDENCTRDVKQTGKVLFVTLAHKQEPECWVVPRRSCFLLSDTGKTIDRI